MATRPLTDLAACLNQLAGSAGAAVSDAELLRRFAEARDETAFDLLVWRHGGLVMGTCRRVLGRSADVDDAFQAVFLALSRKSAAVCGGESLGGWLHCVALRVALRLRATTRRRSHIESSPLPESAPAPSLPLPDDTAAVLDEEIGQLPDKLRVAFVLCHLQGHTHEEAATQLGCPKGTVFSRVARARERLQVRLTRRGFALSAAGVVAVESAVISADLVTGTVRASIAFATGPTDGAISSSAAALAQGVLRSMSFNIMKPVVAALVVVALTVGAVLAARAPTEADPPPAPVSPFFAAPVPPRGPTNFKLALADKGIARVNNIIFSPNGKWVVVGGIKPNEEKEAVVVWDAATGKHVHTFQQSPGLSQAAFSPDSQFFATIPDRETATVWSTDTWNEHVKLTHLYASNVGFSPDGKLALTLERGSSFWGEGGEFILWHKSLKVWDVATGKLMFERETEKDEGFCYHTLAPDSKTIAGVTSVGNVRLLDTKTGKQRAAIQPPERVHPYNMGIETAVSPAGAKILIWTGTKPDGKDAAGTVRLWNVVTGKEERQFGGIDRSIGLATFSPDGKLFVATSDKDVWAWNADTGKKVARFALSQADSCNVSSISFSPDSKVIAVCGSEKTMNNLRNHLSALFALPSGKELIRLPGAKIAQFNSDGKTVGIVSGPMFRDDKLAGPDEVTIRDLADLLKSGR